MSTSSGRPARPLAPVVALILVLSVLSGASPARPAARLPADLPQGQRARCLAIAEAAAVATRVDAEPFVV
ncbi:MAG TPA: hypothetical protein VLF19_07500, partial [Methylomirabilota bacterium]|nr:hypothetical protein [Methylomirabilota bacterium]